jgi:hypothetical protein
VGSSKKGFILAMLTTLSLFLILILALLSLMSTILKGPIQFGESFEFLPTAVV